MSESPQKPQLSTLTVPRSPSPGGASASPLSPLKPITIVPLPHISDWLPDIRKYPNPMSEHRNQQYREETEYILQYVTGNNDLKLRSRQKLDYDAILRAGARREVCFDSAEVNACIVNTGGLCPGLNSVIEELVRSLVTSYRVKKVYGIRFGFRGFDPEEYEPMILTPQNVVNIHLRGGTILGTCRGYFNEDKILNFIKTNGVKMVFVIGGDGSHRAANKIHSLCKEQVLDTVVVGIPKTIDNDILYFDKTFGFDTAVEEACKVINCAFTEASSVKNGVGLVKLMGRDSGFVARNAALSNNVVDACLIPEIPFVLEGEGGFLPWLDSHLEQNQHAVVVISEAAAQQHIPVVGKDATGHNVYEDTGKWMKKLMETHWKETKSEGKVFLIDPSYMIRSVPANSGDNMLCIQLAQAAVHTAFSGYSGVTVGRFHDMFGVMPIDLVVDGHRRVNPKGSIWQTVKARLSFYPGDTIPAHDRPVIDHHHAI